MDWKLLLKYGCFGAIAGAAVPITVAISTIWYITGKPYIGNKIYIYPWIYTVADNALAAPVIGCILGLALYWILMPNAKDSAVKTDEDP